MELNLKPRGELLATFLSEKIFRIMRLTVFLLIVGCLQVSAKVDAQKISLRETNASLEEVFKQVENQSDYYFIYRNEWLKATKKVTIDIQDASIGEVMKMICNNQPIDYSIVNKNIVIKEKPLVAHIPETEKKMVQDIPISGTVVDSATGEPLVGVTIKVQNETIGTTTNAKGQFSLDVPEGAVLEITYLGYGKKVVKVGANHALQIVLQSLSKSLDQVVVTGYQNVERRFFTGSSAKVKAEDAERPGVSDISRMLEGQVAGVSIQNVSGTFGAAPKIRVRGATSISGDNKPLWVIDGVILEDVVNISNEQLSTGDPNTLIGSSVAGLNPDDIASFTILKDAAATAMYGARAMNGVIVVTTKKGSFTEGQPRISITSNWTTFLKPTYEDYNIMNSADQIALNLELESKGYLNQASIVSSSSFGVFGKMYDNYYQVDPITGDFALNQSPKDREAYLRKAALRNTDWFDVLFKNSLKQDYSLSVSSGTEKAKIYASASFLHDNGWTIADKVNRYTGNIRADFTISPKIKIGLLARGSVRDQMTPGAQERKTNVVSGEYERDFDNNPYSYALSTSRALAAYDEDGSYAYYQKNYAPYSILNELNTNTLQTQVLDYRLKGDFSWKILPNLEYAFSGSYRFARTIQEHRVLKSANAAAAYRAGSIYDERGENSHIANSNRFLFTDPDDPSAHPVSVLPHGGFYSRTENSLRNYYMKNSLNWDYTFNDPRHKINVFGLTELRMIDRQNAWNDGAGYQYDKGGVPFFDPVYFKFLASGNDNYYGMGYKYDRYVAFMLRGAYSYDNKYSFNTTVRYDGSNKLGTSTVARWLPTWNVSGAWNVDQEPFFYENVETMSQLRLRATYGLVASMGSATNSSVVYHNANTHREFLSDRENTIEISSLENSELTWEKQFEFNVGADMGFFEDRLTLTVDYYDRKGFDLIGQFRTSGIDGQSIKYANYADMRSKGLEFTLDYRLIDQEDFKWDMRANLSHHTSKITDLQNLPRIWDMVREVGGALVGYPVRGLFSIHFEELDDKGLPLFVDQNGKKQVTDVDMQSTSLDNLVYEGPIDPTITGGFYTAFTWKNFRLGGLFTFSEGSKVRLTPAFRTSYSDMDAANNALLDRWVLYGDQQYTVAPVVVGRIGASGISGYPFNNYNHSDVRVARGDFIRLKQLTLNYDIPNKIASKIKATNASLALVANNVLLLYADKALQGQDPEFIQAGGVSMPIQRQFTLSLKLGF